MNIGITIDGRCKSGGDMATCLIQCGNAAVAIAGHGQVICLHGVSNRSAIDCGGNAISDFVYTRKA